MSDVFVRTQVGYRGDPLVAGLPLLLLTPALFAVNMLVARWAESANIPPLFLAWGRWALAFLILLPVVAPRLWAWRQALRANWLHLTALAVFGMGITVGAQYIGARDTSAANVALIFAACPIMIAVIENLAWRTPIGTFRAYGMLFAVCGVLVVLARGEGFVFTHYRIGEGDLWVLLAACGWAAYTVLSKRQMAVPLPGGVRLAALIGGGALVLLPFAVAEGVSGKLPDFGDYRLYAALGLLAVVPSLGAYFCYDRLVVQVGASGAGVSLYLVPIYTALAAWPLLGEMPQLYHGIGFLLILAGVVLSGLNRSVTNEKAVA